MVSVSSLKIYYIHNIKRVRENMKILKQEENMTFQRMSECFLKIKFFEENPLPDVFQVVEITHIPLFMSPSLQSQKEWVISSKRTSLLVFYLSLPLLRKPLSTLGLSG